MTGLAETVTQSPKNAEYLSTLVQYFEEEIMGEAYFQGLGDLFGQPHELIKLDLLAKIERYAAETMRPLLERYALKPRDEEGLLDLGRKSVCRREFADWTDFMTDISVRYPDYLVQFDALEQMAPQTDRPALRILTNHEIAAIEFANRELAGRLDSTEPMRQYLRDGSA